MAQQACKRLTMLWRRDGGAVRHLLVLKGGREWRLAAIRQGGGITVWRQDGASQLCSFFCCPQFLAPVWLPMMQQLPLAAVQHPP